MLRLTRAQRILSFAYAILIGPLYLSVIVLLGLPSLILVVAWVGLAVVLRLPPAQRRGRAA